MIENKIFITTSKNLKGGKIIKLPESKFKKMLDNPDRNKIYLGLLFYDLYILGSNNIKRNVLEYAGYASIGICIYNTNEFKMKIILIYCY